MDVNGSEWYTERGLSEASSKGDPERYERLLPGGAFLQYTESSDRLSSPLSASFEPVSRLDARFVRAFWVVGSGT